MPIFTRKKKPHSSATWLIYQRPRDHINLSQLPLSGETPGTIIIQMEAYHPIFDQVVSTAGFLVSRRMYTSLQSFLRRQSVMNASLPWVTLRKLKNTSQISNPT